VKHCLAVSATAVAVHLCLPDCGGRGSLACTECRHAARRAQQWSSRGGSSGSAGADPASGSQERDELQYRFSGLTSTSGQRSCAEEVAPPPKTLPVTLLPPGPDPLTARACMHRPAVAPEAAAAGPRRNMRALGWRRAVWRCMVAEALAACG
jgi:hypothetical protein